ncbi:MAG: hypothetical protein JWL59_5022 [Chthoniobacteraceae bacterium]|nr:hypothetical protein [Chthoniobacteraceae bacterium]
MGIPRKASPTHFDFAHNSMPQIVYLLCALTSLACAVLLVRAYRGSHVKLLLWSAICFCALTLTNVLLFVDLVVFPSIDLQPIRSSVTLLGLTALLYGLIFNEK